ncbi:MAG: amidohydrolase family protein [Phycisphaerae bacterium]
MRINVGGLIGSFGDLKFSLDDITRQATMWKLDHILIANISAASRDVGGNDMNEPEANFAALKAAQGDARLQPLYWLRPGRKDCHLAAVQGAMQSAPFVGLVLAPGLNEISLSDPIVDGALEIAGKLELPVIVRIGDDGAWNASRVAALAREHPRVRFVLSGIARHGDVRHASEILRKAQSRGEISLFGDTASCSPDIALEFIRLAGAERVLLSLEECHDKEHAGLSPSRLQEHLELNLRKSEYDAVMGRNALTLFRRLRPSVAKPVSAANAK